VLDRASNRTEKEVATIAVAIKPKAEVRDFGPYARSG
jgi:hypothetical protein